MLNKIKSVFKSNSSEIKYKHYSPSQLKIIAMKSRIVLEQHYKKCLKQITDEDKILEKNKQLSGQCYKILQQVGRKVIEVESIKIYKQLLKKIEDRSVTIVKTNGDIALMKEELQWFQAVLWYRKKSDFKKLQEIHEFCFNFFKGIDVAMQINVKCEIFNIFPILRYLDPKCILPLKKLESQIANYIQTVLDQEIILQIFALNRKDIRFWFKRQKVQYQERFLSQSKSKSPKKNVSPLPAKRRQQPQNMNYMFQSMKPLNKIHEDQQKQSQLEIAKRKQQERFKQSFMKRMNPNKQQKQTNEAIQKKKDVQKQRQQKQKIPQFTSELTYKYSEKCEMCNKNITLIRSSQQLTKPMQKTYHEQDLILCNKCLNTLNDQNQSQDTKVKEPTKQENVQLEQIEHQKEYQQQNKIQGKIADLKIQDSLIRMEEYDYDQKEEQTNLQLNQHEGVKETIFHEQTNDFIYDSMIRDTNDEKRQQTDENHYNFNDNKQQIDQEELNEQNLSDQEQSLSFIREIIQENKKMIKKPYMVSIYARAQFTDKIK